jgi:mannan endo-1,4-beta-mannosidase
LALIFGTVLLLGAKKSDRPRLLKELDLLKASGVNNLRILVGADGPARPSKIQPSLQTAPGVYDDSLLAGLDFLLAEMQRRDMKAILYLTNSWEWSGGYSQYLEWSR